MGVETKTIQQLVEEVMAAQGLTYELLARRRRVHIQTLREQIRELGTSKHQVRPLTQLSLALNKPGDWLLKELRKRGLR